MKRIMIFGKPSCSVCKDALNKVNYFKEKKNLTTEILYLDMETVDGLAESAYYEVSDIPTIVIFENDNELARWVKKPPLSEEFLPYLTTS